MADWLHRLTHSPCRRLLQISGLHCVTAVLAKLDVYNKDAPPASSCSPEICQTYSPRPPANAKAIAFAQPHASSQVSAFSLVLLSKSYSRLIKDICPTSLPHPQAQLADSPGLVAACGICTCLAPVVTATKSQDQTEPAPSREIPILGEVS